MPDNTVIGGQGEDAPADDKTATVKGVAPQEAGQEQPYLHTWKSREDAEKGIEDLQKQLNDARSRADKARQEAQEKSQLAQVLEKLGSVQAPQGPTPEQQQADRAALIEKLDSNLDGELIVGLLEDAMARTEDAATQRSAKEIEDLKQALGQVTERLSEYDPEWQKTAPVIEELGLKEVLGDGVDRNTMIKVAKLISDAKGPSQPDQAVPPGSIGGQAVSGQTAEVDAKTAETVRGLVKAVTGREPTDAQHARAEKKWSKKQ